MRSNRSLQPLRAPIPAARRPAPLLLGLLALALSGAGLATLPSAAQAQVLQGTGATHPTRAFWNDIRGTAPARSATGAAVSVTPTKFRATTLDGVSMFAVLAAAASEGSTSARINPTIISLPDPAGGFQRFSIVDSPVMEAGLAAKYPGIRTFTGKGIDDPTASIRGDITPLGFHASVRSKSGSWYIDPYYHLDTSLYASYYRSDYANARGALVEPPMLEAQISLSRSRFRAAEKVEIRGAGFTPGGLVAVTVRNSETDPVARQTLQLTADSEGVISASITAEPYRSLGNYVVTASDGRTTASSTYTVVADNAPVNATAGPTLKTYRLALVTDPSYATYFGGSANVTPAKVTLINRVTQIYESETSIRLVLINDTDKLNLDTAAQATGANGPCGATACYTAANLASCGSATLTRNRIVTGLLVNASSFDVGHIALGVNGGGIASLGVVGLNNKSQGCTGLPTPVGDFMAIDYVAHELGHQFAGNHTFNGTISNCSGGNRSAANSVESGSGSSVMAYAGICGTDNLQPHSDPYWSFRSFEEVTAHTSAAEQTLSEVQQAALRDFTVDGRRFVLSWNGVNSVPITRGAKTWTTAGIKLAIEQIPGWPAGGTVTISALSDAGFTITFGGTLANTNVPQLQMVSCSDGCTGFVGEIAKGGVTTRQGNVQTATGNSPPVVSTVGAQFTIPLRTPFALTGSATDPDGDTVTYMWEQTDRGGSTGTSLISNTKANGPLFRQFSVPALVTAAGTLQSPSPGQNATTTDPTRVFPDLPQILANNTNADTGLCSLVDPAAQLDCFSEFLPTSDYVGFAGVNASPASLNFRLTGRDGKGGIGNATTQLVLATGTGPFRVTAPNTAVSLVGGAATTVTWDVAGTNAAPISTANVKVSLSVDGGLTYPYVLAASTPNTGTAAVTLPSVASTMARVKVEAVGNVYFDISNADFTITVPAATGTTKKR